MQINDHLFKSNQIDELLLIYSCSRLKKEKVNKNHKLYTCIHKELQCIGSTAASTTKRLVLKRRISSSASSKANCICRISVVMLPYLEIGGSPSHFAR